MTASPPTSPSPEPPQPADPPNTPPAWRQWWLPAGALVVVIVLVGGTLKMSVKSWRGETRMRMKLQNERIEALNTDIHRLRTRVDHLYDNPPAQPE